MINSSKAEINIEMFFMKKIFYGKFFIYIWLGVLCMISCFFCYQALQNIFSYLSLDSNAKTKKISWFKKENWLGRWFLVAEYCYEVNGKFFLGKYEKKRGQYLNESRANEAIERKKGKQKKIFYSYSSPQISALEKIFPYNVTIRAAISLFVFLYFLKMMCFFEKK